MDALLGLFTGGNSTLIGIVVGAIGLLATFIFGRRSGKQSAESKQIKAEQKARDVADEIDDAVAGRSSAENRKDLGRWSRKS